MDRLTDKIVLITGAGKGSGRCLAQAFAKQGAIVAANDVSPINVEEVVDQIVAKGGRAKAYIDDIAKKVAVQNIINQVEDDFGRIDILIHHAAVEPNIPLLDMDEWDWHRTLDVCLTGTFLVNQEVARVMVEQQGGRIINFASTVALTGGPMHAAYSAAKAGVIALTKSMQRELADANIVLMIVAPGATDTPLFRRNHPDGQERRDNARTSRPPARPEEVADVVAFLAANESAHLLAGQTIHTNGGRFLGF